MKVKIPSPKSEFVKSFRYFSNRNITFSLIVNKQNEDLSK